MNKGILSVMMLTLLLIGMLTLAFTIQPTEAEPGTLFMRVFYGIAYIHGDSDLAFGDFDGDGDVDFIAGDWSGDIFLFANSGEATFTRSHIAFIGYGVESSERPASVASGDFDGDGDTDFIAGRRKGDLYLFTNTGAAAFSCSDISTEGFIVNQLHSTDLDTDGDIDFIVGMYGVLAVYWNVAPLVISTTVGIYPQALNLRSKGRWITAYIELPEGYNVSDIDVSSVRLNETFSADLNAPTQIGDYDCDGVPDLMVKFNRTELTSYLYNDLETRVDSVALTVSGELTDGTPFEGTDLVRTLLAEVSAKTMW